MNKDTMDKFDTKAYWEKRLTDDYSLSGVGFIGHGSIYNEYMYKVRKSVFSRVLRPIIRSENYTRALDIGSGTGFYIDLWSKLKINYVEGSDLTEVAVQKLSDKFKSNKFYQLDISSDLDNKFVNQYDVVSAFDILFHIVDDNGFNIAIENISKMVKKNGIFVLSDNFIKGPETRSVHHVSRTFENYKSVLEKNGFKIIRQRPMFYFMNMPVDGKLPLLRWFWKVQSKFIYRGKFWSKLLIAFVYPLEMLMIRIVKDGPSTEIMVCKKVK